MNSLQYMLPKCRRVFFFLYLAAPGTGHEQHHRCLWSGVTLPYDTGRGISLLRSDPFHGRKTTLCKRNEKKSFKKGPFSHVYKKQIHCCNKKKISRFLKFTSSNKKKEKKKHVWELTHSGWLYVCICVHEVLLCKHLKVMRVVTRDERTAVEEEERGAMGKRRWLQGQQQ